MKNVIICIFSIQLHVAMHNPTHSKMPKFNLDLTISLSCDFRKISRKTLILNEKFAQMMSFPNLISNVASLAFLFHNDASFLNLCQENEGIKHSPE